ncbi:DNA replication and repair protein RecF [Candidatus Hepatincola sp. Pdp]
MLPSKFCVINSVTLKNFRNYHNFSLPISENLIVIYGANGIGKTSILEGISLFAAGKGLKGEKLETLLQHNASNAYLSLQTLNHLGLQHLELSIEQNKENNGLRKLYYTSGKQLTSKQLLHNYLDCIWLTPQMDNFFLQDNNHKRKFLDKMIYTLDKTHLTRINEYDKLIKERNRILTFSPNNNSWLNVLDQQIVEYAIPIVASRMAFLHKMNNILQAENTKYKVELSFNGAIETLFQEHQFAVMVEKLFYQQLLENREIDKQSKTTNLGSHKSKLLAVSYLNKQPCDSMSTGEQKMMLLYIISAFAKLCIMEKNNKPILLLDELHVHLDANNTYIILQNLMEHGCQIFITTTNPNLYQDLSKIQFINLDNINNVL